MIEATFKCCLRFNSETHYWTHYIDRHANTQLSLKWCENQTKTSVSIICDPSPQWSKECQSCVRVKRIDNSDTHEFISLPDWAFGREDVMHIDLLPGLPATGATGGYEKIITVLDVFSGYEYLLYNATAVDTAKLVNELMNRQAYLPTFVITDKGSVFQSNVKTNSWRPR